MIKSPPKLSLLDESFESEMVVIRLRGQKSPHRKILYLNDYGMGLAWRLWKQGVYPSNHLWGCIELALKGYEVLIPEPVTPKGGLQRTEKDWNLVRIALRHLGRDDIVYCAHNNLFWIPILKKLRLVGCKIVGQLFSKEHLRLAGAYEGMIAHTPTAKEYLSEICPKAHCAFIPWGMDLDFFSRQSFEPKWFLSTGKTHRDPQVIIEAFRTTPQTVRILHPNPEKFANTPKNILVESDQVAGENIYLQLVQTYYHYAAATIVALSPDPTCQFAAGITNLLESMACGRPVIVTRTGALSKTIDVERMGIGYFVDPSDPQSMRDAVKHLLENQNQARAFGLRGRQLCEEYYNIDRFADDLHGFFEGL